MDRAGARAVEDLNRACGTRELLPARRWWASGSVANECVGAARMHRRERVLLILACRELVLVILLKSAQIPLAAQWGVADRQVVAGRVVTRQANLGRATSEYGRYLRRSEILNDSVSTWLAVYQRPIRCKGRCSWGLSLIHI